MIINRGTSLQVRIYRPTFEQEPHQQRITELEKPVDADIVPVIVFFHGGSLAHSSANSAIYDTLCRRLVGICKVIVISISSLGNTVEGADRDHPACNPFGPYGKSLKGINFRKSLVVVAGMYAMCEWMIVV
ncbi:hypothetical protein SAY86_010842 [Trapa natans]|uniref:Uncharacterized protein n=1 Tax=Trapa natans TaxID=22666 RepID=A0AAN7R0F7_TRANT|nr:hypothetical protein SAY86_010842 [Trapa natans]